MKIINWENKEAVKAAVKVIDIFGDDTMKVMEVNL